MIGEFCSECGQLADATKQLAQCRAKNTELNRRCQEEYARGVKDACAKRNSGRELAVARAEDLQMQLDSLQKQHNELVFRMEGLEK